MPRTERIVDNALAASFPASGPPPWTAGLARPRPVPTTSSARDTEKARLRRDPYFQWTASRKETRGRNGSDVSLLQVLGSGVAAGGLVMLLPFVILLVGMPIALGVRALLGILLWVFPGMR